MRWLDAKGAPNDADPKLQARAKISSSTAALLFEGSGKSWKAGACTPPRIANRKLSPCR